MKTKKLLPVGVMVIVLILMFTVISYAAITTATVNTSGSNLNIRSGPAAGTTLVGAVPNGSTVTVFETVNASDGSTTNPVWCKITYGSLTGYVSKTYLTNFVTTGNENTNTQDEEIPAMYKQYVDRLKALHPNWVFKFYDTGLDWFDVIENETKAGKNSISGAPISYRSTSVNFSDSGAVKTGTVNGGGGSLNLRSEPSSAQGNLTVIAAIPNGTTVTLLGISGNWYQVSCVVNGTSYEGYAASNYIINVTGVANGSDGSLNIRASNTSDSALVTTVTNGTVFNIVKISGNWYQVTFNYNGTDYSGYAYGPYVKDVIGNGYTYTPVEGTSWYQAHGQVIQYYMDPRNSMNENTIFQFENLAYDSQTIDGVQAILNGTFMSGATITTTDNRTITYAEAIMEAAQTYGISPYHVASRIKQEVGAGTSPAATGAGIDGSYVGIYNLYNIGANTGVKDGLDWAYNGGQAGSYGTPWDSPYKSIMGGAQYIASKYIAVGQNTLYFQKFDVIATGGLYNHQYMSNVQAANSESKSVYKAYSSMNVLDDSFIFLIPIYNHMPTVPCELPVSSSEPNYSTDLATEYKEYRDGDLSGDGNVSINDYAIMKQYLTGNASLTETQLSSADIDKDGTVDGFDLFHLNRMVYGYE